MADFVGLDGPKQIPNPRKGYETACMFGHGPSDEWLAIVLLFMPRPLKIKFNFFMLVFFMIFFKTFKPFTASAPGK